MYWRWFYLLLVPFTLPNVLVSLLLALPYGTVLDKGGVILVALRL